MLFNFFKNNQNQEEQSEDEVLAKISYIITKSSDSIIVDVELSQYDDDSIKAICDILDTLSKEKSILNTLDIIKHGMIDDGEEDSIIKLISYLDSRTKNILINSYKNSEGPCIKPSDIFLK